MTLELWFDLFKSALFAFSIVAACCAVVGGLAVGALKFCFWMFGR